MLAPESAMPNPTLSESLHRIRRRVLSRVADPDSSDDRLVTRFVATRDPAAFAMLVERHGPMVLAICRRITDDRHLAEDAFQAVFLVLSRRAAVVNPPAAVRGWLYGVAVRSARGVRATRTRRCWETLVGSVPDLPAPDDEHPDDGAIRILHAEIARLADRLRAPVVLCELDGLSRRDAATRLGVPEGTLSSRLAEARKILAVRLKSQGLAAVGLAGLVDRSLLAANVPSPLIDAAARMAVPDSVSVSAATFARGVIPTMFFLKFQPILLGVGLLIAGLIGVGLISAQPATAKRADPPAGQKAPVRPAPEMTAAQIRDAAVKGITDNYAQLKTVAVTVECVALDPTVKQREVTTTVLPGGAVATLVREPRSTHKSKILLRGEEVRCETNTDDGPVVFAFTAGVWTQYHPNDKQAWLRRPDQMPGMYPFDPREAGNTEIRGRLLDRLKDDTLLQVSKRDAKVIITMERATGRQIRYELDPARNHLPTRVCELHDDGSVNVVVDVSYQEVGRGKTWFPKEVTETIYGKPGAKAGDPGWTGRTTRTFGKVAVNEPLAADAFKVEIPPETLISDSTGIRPAGK